MPARHFSSVLLPLPLRPTIPKNSPGCDGEGDVLERVQLLVARAAQRVKRALLERVAALLGDLEALVDALGGQRGASLRGCCSAGTVLEGIARACRDPARWPSGALGAGIGDGARATDSSRRAERPRERAEERPAERGDAR